MRELKCRGYGFTKPIMGKVTHSSVRKKLRADHVLVGSNIMRKSRGYAAVLVKGPYNECQKLESLGVPVAVSEDPIDQIRNSDVILIEPENKRITVLFESASWQNVCFVTSRCNSACIMCPQPPQPDPEERFAMNKRLVELMAPGPQTLALTGGEPTVLGDSFISLLSHCRQFLPETNLLLLTNARRFNDLNYVDRLLQVGYPKLSVAVPLYADTDSDHDNIMGVNGAFAETVAGLHNLALYQVPVEIRIVIMSLNYKRLVNIAEFIYRNLTFVCHVAFMGLETCGSAAQNINKIWIDPYDYRTELLSACKFLGLRGIPVSVYNHQLCVLPKELWPVARKSISGWKNMYLPVCHECALQPECGGFFSSGLAKFSSHITPKKAPNKVADTP